MTTEPRATMTGPELRTLRTIIRHLRDIARSAADGTRNRDYCLTDLEEDVQELAELVAAMGGGKVKS